MEPLVPSNEPRRLQALRQYRILDTAPEPCFDKIVRQAAARFKTPIAIFSLIDEKRQWFKARVGLGITETDRAISFCAHAVAINAPLVVEDTLKNRIFADSYLVVCPPKVRFYAGVPVHARSGEPIGALCVIDRSPRSFPWSHYLLLKKMAGQVEEQLEFRKLSIGSFGTPDTH